MGTTGCRSGDGDNLTGPVDPAHRTLLVYLGGDNNLSGEARHKLNQMVAGWNSSIDGRLVAFLDPVDDTPRLLELRLDKTGDGYLHTIEVFEERDSADPEVLAEVIGRLPAEFEADSYGLLLFSHATGWLPPGSFTSPYGPASRSVIADKNNEMELADFAAAIPDGMFDFIIFEACLMAGVEVAYELRHKADYIVASAAEILSPGFSPVYPAVIRMLLKESADLVSFTDMIFEYLGNIDPYRAATLSIIRTSGLEKLAAWLQNKADFSREVEINKIQHFDRNSYRLFFDLQQYCNLLLRDQSDADELTEMIDGCIVKEYATEEFLLGHKGFVINSHCGLTTYIEQDQFEYLNAEYARTGWYKATRGIKQ